VTLICGIQCSDGLLLAADREETDGIGKFSAQKIHEFSGREFQLGLAGAGDSSLADKAVLRIVASAGAEKFRAEHEQIIETELRQIYATYVWDERIPESDERGISLIVGLCDTVSRQNLLYCSVDEILWMRTGFACAGCGEMLGSYLLERFYTPQLAIAEATVLMRFVLSEVKSSVAAVGGQSEILALTASGASRALAGDDGVPRLADVLAPFWRTKPGAVKIAGRKARVSK